jgi:hypothetical protein
VVRQQLAATRNVDARRGRAHQRVGARLRGDTAGSRVEVVAVAPGVATIEAQSGDVRGQIEITVSTGDGGAGPLDGGAVGPDEDAGAIEGEADGGH